MRLADAVTLRLSESRRSPGQGASPDPRGVNREDASEQTPALPLRHGSGRQPSRPSGVRGGPAPAVSLRARGSFSRPRIRKPSTPRHGADERQHPRRPPAGGLHNVRGEPRNHRCALPVSDNLGHSVACRWRDGSTIEAVTSRRDDTRSARQQQRTSAGRGRSLCSGRRRGAHDRVGDDPVVRRVVRPVTAAGDRKVVNPVALRCSACEWKRPPRPRTLLGVAALASRTVK